MKKTHSERKRVLIINTIGLIYDGITNVITSYLEAMNLDGLDIYVAGTIRVEPKVRAQLQNMGCRVIDFPSRRSETIKYFLEIIKFVRKKKIEVVHAHGNSATQAIEMCAAWLGGCKKRIAHSHNTRCEQVKADRLLRPVFYLFCTDALACGEAAGKWLYGNRKFKILQNGRNIEKFAYDPEVRKAMRVQEKLDNQIVIGHVGGFVEQKNHKFLLKIFWEVLKLEKNAKLYLIGDGAKREEIERLASDIKNQVIFVGNTDRVSDYLQMMDGMILPSLFEGLPLVAIEWQINGLPCIFSDTITKECAFTNTVEYESLSTAPEMWANRILKMIKENDREKSSSIARELVRKSGFDIQDNAESLRNIYLN